MRQIRGLTLIELMVVLAISAILVTLAAPSFTRMIKSNSISSNVNTFLADVRFARSEAVRLGGAVVMCRSNAPEAANPSCNTGMGPNSNGWGSGWIIFQDLNNDAGHDNNELVLRVQQPITSIDSIIDNKSSPTYKVRFTATGRLLNMSSNATLQFGSNDNYSNDLQRVVCISLGGRAKIAGDGTAGCA